MPIIIIILVLAFGTILCLYEIPKMVQNNSYRDLWTFCIILALGITITILKSLQVTLPNPSDWVAWAFSPFSELVKNYIK